MARTFDCAKILQSVFSKSECENISWWLLTRSKMTSVELGHLEQQDLLNLIKNKNILGDIGQTWQMIYNTLMTNLDQGSEHLTALEKKSSSLGSFWYEQHVVALY